MSQRIERIRQAVQAMHHCVAVHVDSTPVHEVFKGFTMWQGVVETFNITGHPKAKRCYAWEIPGEKPDYVAALEAPPIVSSPVDAVRASIMFQSKNP